MGLPHDLWSSGSSKQNGYRKGNPFDTKPPISCGTVITLSGAAFFKVPQSAAKSSRKCEGHRPDKVLRLFKKLWTGSTGVMICQWALQKLLAIVDSAQNHRNVEAMVAFIHKRVELAHVCTIGRDCAPLHRPTLDLGQPLCTCSLQWSCHLCPDAHGNGVTHKEKLQGLSLIVAACMAVALAGRLSFQGYRRLTANSIQPSDSLMD